MAEAARSTPPSWPASLRSIGGDGKVYDTDDEPGAQYQGLQHIIPSSLLSLRGMQETLSQINGT
jgi:hypothetical protein